MIFDSEVSDLVLSIESGCTSPESIKQLINKLDANIKSFAPTVSKLKNLKTKLGDLYPLENGYAKAFDRHIKLTQI